MKVCLYLEFSHFARGRLYRRVGTGFASSFRNYLKALKLNHVEATTRPAGDYDILHVNSPYLASLWQIFKTRLCDKKIVVSAHATAEDLKGVWRLSPITTPFAARYYSFAYGLADAVVAPSTYTKSILMKYGIDERKIFVVSNGVDSATFRRPGIGINKGSQGLLIINVANAIQRKGTRTFAETARNFPSCRFLWHGRIFNTVLFPPLPKNLAPNVQFCGYTPDIVAAYSRADIFFFPSYEENQGMAILEAASMGLPILVRDLPVYKGWLKNGLNCLMGKNDRHLREQLHRLIKNPGLRQKLGHEAMKLAKSNDLVEIGKDLENVYNSLQ